jgi:PAS domain S-box-containing protein
MDRKMKILILEHDPSDIDLLKYELKRSFPLHTSQVVQSEKDFVSALLDFEPNIVLSDYSLPAFDGVTAFQITQKIAPNTPFILVSGTIGEENAVELIKSGVTDYALKDKLYALVPKVIRALNEADDKQLKKKMQESLQTSESNLRAMFENTDVGFLFLNTDYTVVAFNQVSDHWASDLFGLELKENANFKKLLTPERLIDFTSFAGRILKGNDVTYETNFPKTDGGIIWYNVNGKPVTDKGKVIGLCIAVTDITSRKTAEEEIKKLNTELEERVKIRTAELVEANTALEAFSYSVSHDLRSPVRSVMGFTQIINKEYGHGLNEDLKELFGHIEKSSKRMNAIIDDLLALAKFGKEKLQIMEVDMHKLFSNVWDHLLFTNPHNAVIEMVPLPKVPADGSMIEQVVVNLLSNAVKYSSKKEKPLIKIGFEETEDGIIFYVKDNGAGFDMKSYDRLFGAFQRLHGVSEFEGTGVGLMLIKRIVERHGGSVWAEGKVNEGAVFYFSLPKSMPTTGRLERLQNN